MQKVLLELVQFVLSQKKFWLIPVLIFLALMLVLIILSLKSGAAAPFLYPLF